jgi:DNA/RNA endonuclease G (NUC1)
VLSGQDPVFINTVNGKILQIPIFFWKVVVFPKADGRLDRVAFMMYQKQLLSNSGIVIKPRAKLADDDLFLKFKNAKTYQVNVRLTEQLADIEFPKAIDVYQMENNIELVLKRIEIDCKSADFSTPKSPAFGIKNFLQTFKYTL